MKEQGEIEVEGEVFYYETNRTHTRIDVYEDDGSYLFACDEILPPSVLKSVIKIYKKGFAHGEIYGRDWKMIEIKETLGLL